MDVGIVQHIQDVCLDLFRVGLAVVKIPCLGIEAAGAVMGAARDEEGDSEAGAIGCIAIVNQTIVHYWDLLFNFR